MVRLMTGVRAAFTVYFSNKSLRCSWYYMLWTGDEFGFLFCLLWYNNTVPPNVKYSKRETFNYSLNINFKPFTIYYTI